MYLRFPASWAAVVPAFGLLFAVACQADPGPSSSDLTAGGGTPPTSAGGSDSTGGAGEGAGDGSGGTPLSTGSVVWSQDDTFNVVATAAGDLAIFNDECVNEDSALLIDGTKYEFLQTCSWSRIDLETGLWQPPANYARLRIPGNGSDFGRGVDPEGHSDGTVVIRSFLDSGPDETPSVFDRAPLQVGTGEETQVNTFSATGELLWNFTCRDVPEQGSTGPQAAALSAYNMGAGNAYLVGFHRGLLDCSGIQLPACDSEDGECPFAWRVSNGVIGTSYDFDTSSVTPRGSEGLVSTPDEYPVTAVTALDAAGELDWSFSNFTYPILDSHGDGTYFALLSYDLDFPGEGDLIVLDELSGEEVMRVSGVHASQMVVGAGVVWILYGYSVGGDFSVGVFDAATGDELGAFGLDTFAELHGVAEDGGLFIEVGGVLQKRHLARD